jgi:FkbM family methyltransferase
MLRPSPPFFSSPAYERLSRGRKLVVVDGGARGELVPPLDRIPVDRRTAVRFEPEPAAPILQNDGEIVLRKALWSAPTKLKLHITNEPSCSSVYPPDDRLVASYVDLLGHPARKVRVETDVEADAIDRMLPEAGVASPDFIKLDIHSAEYEALEGAQEALKTSVVGLLVECWPVPIHRGQRTFADLDRLITSLGFLPFEVAVGVWPLKSPVRQRYTSKGQSVQFEILYLKDVHERDLTKMSVPSFAALIGFSELFGQVTYALQATASAEAQGLLTADEAAAVRGELLRLNRVSLLRHFVSKVARRTRQVLNPLILPVHNY